MAKKLRLLITEDCNRSCEGCCNTDWDLQTLPVCKDYAPYDEILLTGGEPLEHPGRVWRAIDDIRLTSEAKIYIYTARLTEPNTAHVLLCLVDGMCVTLHEQSDVETWKMFAGSLHDQLKSKSLRLNIFKGVEVGHIPPEWQVKKDIEWVKDSPLPDDEVFMRLKGGRLI